MRRRDEGGSVVVFVTIWTTVVLIGAGLLYDGGLILAAHRRAFDIAESAARAGAQQLDPQALQAGVGPGRLDPATARARAEDFLTAAGATGTAAADGDGVRVQVRIRQPVTLLGLVRIGPQEVVGTGFSRVLRGTAVEE